MTVEIERKWLIELDDVPFDLHAVEKHHIVQSYLCFSPQVRLREIDDGAAYFMTVKVGRDEHAQLARPEFEAEISAASYEELLTQKIGKTILKTRYIVPVADEPGHTFEIDVFEGEFAGLCVAEMEFSSDEEATAYPDPDWVVRDITYDATMKNIVMAQGSELFKPKSS